MKTHTLVNLMATVLVIAILFAVCHAAFGDVSYFVNYSLSPSEKLGTVKGYSGWYQPTNAVDKNVWQWFGETTNGSAILFIPIGVPNGSWIAVTANGATNQSAYSVPVIFETNQLNQTLSIMPPTGIVLKAVIK